MTGDAAIAIGRMNRLQIVKNSSYGLFLDGYDKGEILLPRRHVPEAALPGDWLEVFIYADSEDRLVATTEQPKAMVGEVASLRVSEANAVGAFLDWGLSKDLLVPFSEQATRMREGYSYCVYLYVDKYSDRVVASSKLSKFVPEHSEAVKPGQKVQLLVCSKSDLGFKCLVDESCLALLHHGDIFQPLKPGRKLTGYIKHIRPDGRIDLCLSPPGVDQQSNLEQRIMDHLAEQGGAAPIGDKTPPDEIYALFQTSKKNFKRALSSLYKSRKIAVDSHETKLVDE